MNLIKLLSKVKVKSLGHKFLARKNFLGGKHGESKQTADWQQSTWMKFEKVFMTWVRFYNLISSKLQGISKRWNWPDNMERKNTVLPWLDAPSRLVHPPE